MQRPLQYVSAARYSEPFAHVPGYFPQGIVYCYNDIAHAQAFAHVEDMGIREAIEKREKMVAISAICDDCNMRHRYRPKEILVVAKSYISGRVNSRIG
jgi:hypothetical protein